jgi:hypothetical protein
MMIKCELQWSHESRGLQNVEDEQMDFYIWFLQFYKLIFEKTLFTKNMF